MSGREGGTKPISFEKSRHAFWDTKLGRIIDTAVLIFSFVLMGLMCVGVFIMAIKENVAERRSVVIDWTRADRSIDQEIIRLTRTLNEAAAAVGQIERSIEARRVVVEQLQKDAADSRALAELTQPQREAIQASIRGEMDREQSAAVWWGIASNLFWALFGIVALPLWKRIRRRLGAGAEQ